MRNPSGLCGVLQTEQQTPGPATAAARAAVAAEDAAMLECPAVTPRCDANGRPDVSAEEVVASRMGDVLLRHTILKEDHFPGGWRRALFLA